MNGVRRMSSRVLVVMVTMALVALVSGCRQESNAERVSRLRSGYTATLNGFVVQQEPMTEAEAATEPEQSSSAESSDTSEAAASQVPVQQNVMLDILIRNDNDERLPGITLDVSQADSEHKEKAAWKIWVDTSEIGRGPGTQLSYLLKNVDYVEGDGFNVEVTHPVPASERGQYREFSSAADASGD